MKFYIDSKELNAGLLSVIKALPVRTTMPILEGIYIEAIHEGIILKCSDLMLQKECLIPATVEEEGKVILPGKLFSEMVRKLPDAITEIFLDGKTVNMVCGRAKSCLQSIAYEDFPDMRFLGDTFTVKLDHQNWKDMINQTVFATAQDESKPILTGVLLEIGESITIVATDAYQFALRTMPLKHAVAECSVVIPGKSMIEIARMMEETDADAELTFTKTHVKVEINHSSLVARLLDGDYIKYKQILPKEHITRVLIDRTELMESIDRAQLMAREGNNNIVLKFHENRLNITANSSVGNINEEVDVQINGEDIDIAFNPKYCMNILKCIPDEKIYMDFNSSISPCVIKPAQGDGYYYLIVPVRIYSQF
ncbi:MAG: DNA polymerase III subunit beta [Clostridia bacterium]